MTEPRTSNADINRALGRLEGAVDAMAKAAEGTNANVSALLAHVTDLRADVRALQAQMEPVAEQTQWIKEKRAQGVGFLAAISFVLMAVSSAAGAVGSQVWSAFTGTDA